MVGPDPAAHPVVRLAEDRLDEAIALHCEAFFDYPTMRFVLGSPEADYGERLAALVGYFQHATRLEGGTCLALEENGRLIAAADAVFCTPSSNAEEPEELSRRREALWAYLGPAARSRYEAYCAVKASFVPSRPHHYLSMLGVAPRQTGRGLARPLLNAVHALSRADPRSTGVALETEEPANVAFYEHFGYRTVGHGRVGDGLESWGFFHSDETPPRP